MVSLLLEKGATINAFDKRDRRAIHWASYMGHVDVVRLLLDRGAEVNCTDKQVWIPSLKTKKKKKKKKSQKKKKPLPPIMT